MNRDDFLNEYNPQIDTSKKILRQCGEVMYTISNFQRILQKEKTYNPQKHHNLFPFVSRKTILRAMKRLGLIRNRYNFMKQFRSVSVHLPYRIIVEILSYHMIFVNEETQLTDFYGYFIFDRTRKIFLTFNTVRVDSYRLNWRNRYETLLEIPLFCNHYMLINCSNLAQEDRIKEKKIVKLDENGREKIVGRVKYNPSKFFQRLKRPSLLDFGDDYGYSNNIMKLYNKSIEKFGLRNQRTLHTLTVENEKIKFDKVRTVTICLGENALNALMTEDFFIHQYFVNLRRLEVTYRISKFLRFSNIDLVKTIRFFSIGNYLTNQQCCEISKLKNLREFVVDNLVYGEFRCLPSQFFVIFMNPSLEIVTLRSVAFDELYSRDRFLGQLRPFIGEEEKEEFYKQSKSNLKECTFDYSVFNREFVEFVIKYCRKMWKFAFSYSRYDENDYSDMFDLNLLNDMKNLKSLSVCGCGNSEISMNSEGNNNKFILSVQGLEEFKLSSSKFDENFEFSANVSFSNLKRLIMGGFKEDSNKRLKIDQFLKSVTKNMSNISKLDISSLSMGITVNEFNSLINIKSLKELFFQGFDESEKNGEEKIKIVRDCRIEAIKFISKSEKLSFRLFFFEIFNNCGFLKELIVPEMSPENLNHLRTEFLKKLVVFPQKMKQFKSVKVGRSKPSLREEIDSYVFSYQYLNKLMLSKKKDFDPNSVKNIHVEILKIQSDVNKNLDLYEGGFEDKFYNQVVRKFLDYKNVHAFCLKLSRKIIKYIIFEFVEVKLRYSRNSIEILFGKWCDDFRPVDKKDLFLVFGNIFVMSSFASLLRKFNKTDYFSMSNVINRMHLNRLEIKTSWALGDDNEENVNVINDIVLCKSKNIVLRRSKIIMNQFFDYESLEHLIIVSCKFISPSFFRNICKCCRNLKSLEIHHSNLTKENFMEIIQYSNWKELERFEIYQGRGVNEIFVNQIREKYPFLVQLRGKPKKKN